MTNIIWGKKDTSTVIRIIKVLWPEGQSKIKLQMEIKQNVSTGFTVG